MSSEDIPIKDRTYAVMTDSHRIGSRAVLARMAPHCSRESGFWTEDDPGGVWEMDRQTAEEVVSKLGYNSPRIVRYKKAVALISAQKEAQIAREKEKQVDDTPELPGM